MVAVADLERFLERVFERTSARLFRSRIHAVQVERRVERAMEAGRTGRGTTTTVPDRYRVRLHPTDLDDLASRTGGFEALAVRLADRALAFARLHSYHLAARPMVSVVADPSLEPGRVEVEATDIPPGPTSPTAGHQPGDDRQSGASKPFVRTERSGAGSSLAGQAPWPAQATDTTAPDATGRYVLTSPADLPTGAVAMVRDPDRAMPPFDEAASAQTTGSVPPPWGERADAPPSPAEPPPFVPLPTGESGPAQGPRIAPLATTEQRLRTGDRAYAVRPVPPPPSRALLRVVQPGGLEREVRVEGEPLTLGRAPDNGLVIADARVSRHHGRFQARHGTLVYTDLGSTNGTRVNGIRVDEIVLGPGDLLQVGDVVLVVEQLPH